jgi:hypothetical protein
MNLLERIDKTITEETGIAPPPTANAAEDLVQIATQLQEMISTHQRDLRDFEIQLNQVMEQLNTRLGWEIRKRQPRLMVTHKDGCCNAGYFSKNLAFKPNIKNKAWNVEGPLANKFMGMNPEGIKLSGDQGELADLIVNFFKQHFKTLK